MRKTLFGLLVCLFVCLLVLKAKLFKIYMNMKQSRIFQSIFPMSVVVCLKILFSLPFSFWFNLKRSWFSANPWF